MPFTNPHPQPKPPQPNAAKMKTPLQIFPPPPPPAAYDPQLPFYGPGALACWYLSLLCVLLTWTLHPTKSFVHLSLTPDVAFYTLYACLAAGHMAVQAARFSASELDQLRGTGALGWSDARVQYHDVTGVMDEGMKGMVAGLNVSFRVGVYFFWVGGCVLGAVAGGKRMWPRGMGPVRRRERALPWMVAGAEAWTVGCFGLVAARCGFWTVVGAFWEYTLINGILVGASALMTYLGFFISGMLYTVPRYGFWPEMREFWEEARAKGVDYRRLLVMLVIGLWVSSLGLLHAFVAVWVLYWAVPLSGFPDLGVSITGLDQILALCTGLVALAFISSSVIQARFGDWKTFWVWVRAEWDKEVSKGQPRKQRKASSQVQPGTDLELASLSGRGEKHTTGQTTAWKYG